jgi:hypothetical protein
MDLSKADLLAYAMAVQKALLKDSMLVVEKVVQMVLYLVDLI